jgi:hypothetical protein
MYDASFCCMLLLFKTRGAFLIQAAAHSSQPIAASWAYFFIGEIC